jgi:ketosteroid isomerase-like protein
LTCKVEAMLTSLEDATQTIATEWQAAWNAHDMSRMAALLTPDVDFVNVLGGSTVPARVSGASQRFARRLPMTDSSPKAITK